MKHNCSFTDIMADNSEDFLKDHYSEIVDKTRTPITLADALLANGFINDQLYNQIDKEKREEDQMRKIYKFLNSEKHFYFTYNWLKKNEADLIEELEKKDTKTAAPQRKKCRVENKPVVDETDNHTGFPDLKQISTFAKLETWVSENSQQLISDLEKRIGEEQMKTLENELKNKKLKKKNLCFSDTNIDDIRKNRDLDKSKFPKLTLRMFFDDTICRSLRIKDHSSTASDKPVVMIADDLNSSGYGSNKSEQSSLNLTQNDAQTSDETIFTEPSHTRDTNLNENKDNKDVQETQKDKTDGQTQPPGQPPNVFSKSPNQSINERMIKNANVQEPFSSEPLHKSSPASTSDNMSSNGSWDTHQNSKTEIIAQIKDTEMPAQENMQNPVQERKSSSMRNQPSTSGANKANKAKKNNDGKKLLHVWANKQCTGNKEKVKEILDQISFIYKAEHRDYPFFIAEDVIVYKNPTTCERQIIYIKDKKNALTKVQYHMFVCDIKNTIVLDPEETEAETELKENMITYNEKYLHIDKCLEFISEVLAPALAVYKRVQKEKLYSLI